MPIAGHIRRYMKDSSWIRRMFEIGNAMKSERGESNVFDLSLGNPVIEPPPQFTEQLQLLVNNPVKGMHRYMPNAGYFETRQAIAQGLVGETGLPYDASDVLMTVGAGGAINVALHAILNPGDEVIIFTPYFGEYIFYVLNHMGNPIVVDCDKQFIPDLKDLSTKINDRTRAVLLNSPNNPSGIVYDNRFLQDLASVLAVKGKEFNTEIYVISDEPYRKIIFDELNYSFPQLLHIPTLTVNSHSKDLGLPGERIGYIAIHPLYEGKQELMDAFIFCNRVMGFVNAPALMQKVIVNLQGVTIDVGQYARNRDYLYGELEGLGYKVVKPHGAFYMFPESPNSNELLLVEALQRHGVLVVPGRGFGSPGYFRISYCVDETVLEGAMKGFRAVAKEFGL